jgi:hypothetical protein
MLATHPGEDPMKRMLVAVVSGLLCVCAAREGRAEPTPAAPSVPATNPGGADSGPATGGVMGVPNAGATPLTPEEYLPKLHEFYTRGDVLYNSSKSKKLRDQEIDLRYNEFIAWANEAGAWMNANMTPDATARFTTWHAQFGSARKLSGNHSQEENNKFATLNVVLPQLLANMQFLMRLDKK